MSKDSKPVTNGIVTTADGRTVMLCGSKQVEIRLIDTSGNEVKPQKEQPMT